VLKEYEQMKQTEQKKYEFDRYDEFEWVIYTIVNY
jgi:hypothetical protein